MDELKESLLSSGGTAANTHTVPSPGRSARVRDFTLRSNNAVADRAELPHWMYPPDGETHSVAVPADELRVIRNKLATPPPHLLGEWRSTSICGNDILASVLYSSGIVHLERATKQVTNNCTGCCLTDPSTRY